MAAVQTAPANSVTEASTEGLRRMENTELAEHGRLFGLLWLHPEISRLTKPLIGRLQESWHYHSAFLLEEMLELQLIYTHTRGKRDLADPLVPDGALLGSEDVLEIARTLLLNVPPYHLKDFQDIIDREMRFKLLASVLHLSRSSGGLSSAQADYHRIKKALNGQLEDTLRARSAAEREGHTVQNLGNDDLFIRDALQSFVDTPRDIRSSSPLFDAIARIFFAVEGQYDIDLAGALGHFHVAKDPSDKTRRWILQALCRLASEAVSLAQLGFSVIDQRARETIIAKAKEIAECLALKIELLLQQELLRLQRLKKRHALAAKIQISRSTAFQPSAGETSTLLDLLHAANRLATWFGKSQIFDVTRDLCRDLITQLASSAGFQPLRLKAVSNLPHEWSCDSNLLPRPLQVVTEQTASAKVSRELDLSRAVFMARKASISSSIRFALEELSKQQHRALATTDCQEQSPTEGGNDCLSSRPLDYQATEAKAQGAGEPEEGFPPQIDLDRLSFRRSVYHRESVDEDSDCDTHSSYSCQSPELIPDIASPPLISDLKHQIALTDELREIGNPNESEKMTVLTGEPKPLTITPNSQLPQYARDWELCAKKSTIQELPGDEPAYELESPSLFCGSRGRFGSVPSHPWLGPTGISSQSSYGATDTPVTSEIVHSRASESIDASSNSSRFNLQGVLLDLQKPRTDVDVARKIKFLQNAKKADYIAFSPNNEHAAFIFPNQIQVCRLSYGVGGYGTFAIKVMLASGKKGKFVAAELSDTHLVAISDKEVQTCRYLPLETSPTSVTTRQIEHNVRVTCVAISPDSEVVALGQRVRPDGPDRASIRYQAAIQLYSTGLVLRESLKCQAAGDNEFPRHLSFYPDGQTLLYSNNRTLGHWTRTVNVRRETSLGALDAKGPGAKGITSITPVSLPPQNAGHMNVPFCGITYESPKYYLVTSVLSNIADDTSSYISSLSNRSRSKSGTPWCEHLVRSAVSADGRLAAFLTQSGHLKMANLVASDDGAKLLMRSIPCDKFQAKKEADTNHAPKIGIRDGLKGFTVVVVDRHGNVNTIKVTESQTSRRG
ncbi:MAG: hypothetical protein Q9207_003590 [Kuettlingeria erythrocarpa]